MLERPVALPDSVEAARTSTPRGDFATLIARPNGVPCGLYLLVPGFTGSKEDFSPLLPLLADAGWLAVSYDQRGQYESRAGADADYSLDALAADVLSLTDAFGVPRPCRLLGHSFGGLVAQTAVLTDPGAWDELVLLCTGPAAFTGARKRADLGTLAAVLGEHPLELVHEMRESHARRRGEAAGPSADVAAFLRERFVANSATSLRTFVDHLLGSPDRIDALAATGVPTTVIRGVDDDAWPFEVQEDMARRLGTQVCVVPDAGHSPAVENPAALAAVLL